MLSRNKKFLLLLIVLLGAGISTNAFALTFEMELVASIPNPSVPGESLSSRIILGTEDRATDRFDTAWDVVAIQGGVIQAYIEHPDYDQETQALWRDTRASTGFPKEWDLYIQPSLPETSVTLDWSATDLSNLPSNIRLRLVDLDSGDQELDIRSVSTYTYLHNDHTVAHHYQIILDESDTAAPPSDPIPPTGDSSAGSDTPPINAPPIETPPQVSAGGPDILTDLLPPGVLRRNYTARLEAQGGTAPYRWQIVSGELPRGLSLDHATGEISGRPRRIGQYRLMIQLIDGSGLIQQKAFTLSIARRAITSLQ